MYETGWLFNSFTPEPPVTAHEDPHPLPLVMSSALTFRENFVSYLVQGEEIFQNDSVKEARVKGKKNIQYWPENNFP